MGESLSGEGGGVSVSKGISVRSEVSVRRGCCQGGCCQEVGLYQEGCLSGVVEERAVRTLLECFLV